MKTHGEWQDTLIYKDGSDRVIILPDGEFVWGKNQIQNSFALLLGALLRDEPGYSRIGFIGIGSGNASWDTVPPTKSYSATTLNNEVFRKAIPQADIIFIDPDTDISTGGVPSSKLEITYTLDTTEANYDLREFGLFGGEATASFDTGSMVNWVSHTKIEKTSAFELNRRIRLTFDTQ